MCSSDLTADRIRRIRRHQTVCQNRRSEVLHRKRPVAETAHKLAPFCARRRGQIAGGQINRPIFPLNPLNYQRFREEIVENGCIENRRTPYMASSTPEKNRHFLPKPSEPCRQTNTDGHIARRRAAFSNRPESRQR